MEKIKLILRGLKEYYSEPLTVPFRSFRNGLIYFTTGFIILYLAHNNLPPSLKQELLVLAGLCMIAVGFFMAMMAHIKMIISRIVTFFTKK